MESYTVCQMQREMRWEGFLLIRSADRRKDSRGSEYVDMNLADRTGEINCKIWNWNPDDTPPAAGGVIKVRGTVQEYNGRLQLRVEKWRPAEAEDRVDMTALVACAPRSPEEMEAEIRDAIRRPLGARSVSEVKLRTRAGMGRCQGGFCSPRVLEILSEELGISPLEVTQCGGRSTILSGRACQGL
jgi:DNA polymerase III alpha subunit